ncbi:MAG: glycoside hydrolase family 78 protein [Paludibacteraceae bacterium]|nr:glycoside hydrolase family 78 protein [Paludibacteraceae bacterium]
MIACQHPFSIMSDPTVGELTKALPDSLWEVSDWISVVNAPISTEVVQDSCRAADGANWFVYDLSSLKSDYRSIIAAKWMTTSLGIMQLYINEQRVGREFLRPGYTHYAKTKRSFTYDITYAIQDALSSTDALILSAQVTPGWWADKIITPAGTTGMYGRKCAFRSVLMLEYADGTYQYIGTDTLHWRAGIAGPVTHAAIFDGEEYDARIPMGYETPERLSTPEINTEFTGEILPTNGAEVYLRYDLMLPPIAAYTYDSIQDADSAHYGRVHLSRKYKKEEPIVLRKGETLVLDFGQNCAAVPSFVFKAEEGTVLTCAPGELLNDSLGSHQRGMDGPEGSVHRRNLRIPHTGVTIYYTFGASSHPIRYTPQCTYFGYRYLSITSTDEVKIYAVRSIPVSSITSALETGTITTGNALINRLILNTIWGQRSNYLSIPTDCPQRNERLGWTADTQVFCRTGAYFANTLSFFRKWLRDLRDTQHEDGGYPGVAPFGQYGSSRVDNMRVGWSDAGVIVPYTMFVQFADTALIEEHWSSMERYIDHAATYQYDHTALFADNGGYQWGDWLSYEALESFSGQPWNAQGLRPEAAEYWSYLCGSYWIIDAEMMLTMARALGRDQKKYSDMVASARSYMQKRFLNSDGSFRLAILNTMQTPALFALRCHLVDGAARQAMITRLRENIAEHGQCLQTGFLGTSILMPTLTENGLVDIAYDLLFQHRNPSWLYSVDQGATTIWERWNSYTIEQGMAPNGMNSFNHYAYGCVCEWIWETCAGIAADPTQPGFRHIIMRPIPDRRLGSIDATYQSSFGPIHSEWHYEGESWVWTFTIPTNTTATVTLPCETESREYSSGTYTITL